MDEKKRSTQIWLLMIHKKQVFKKNRLERSQGVRKYRISTLHEGLRSCPPPGPHLRLNFSACGHPTSQVGFRNCIKDQNELICTENTSQIPEINTFSDHLQSDFSQLRIDLESHSKLKSISRSQWVSASFGVSGASNTIYCIILESVIHKKCLPKSLCKENTL